MRRSEPDYRPLRAAILIWIPLVLIGCTILYYRLVTP
jgi:hypothetical protein